MPILHPSQPNNNPVFLKNLVQQYVDFVVEIGGEEKDKSGDGREGGEGDEEGR